MVGREGVWLPASDLRGGGGDSDITRRAPDLPTSVGDNLNGYSPQTFGHLGEAELGEFRGVILGSSQRAKWGGF